MPSLPESFRLDDRVAVITGGASGLGFDMAETFAAAGCNVIVTSRSLERATQSAKRLADLHGIEIRGLKLEQCEADSIARCIADADQWKGRIDILVNNAGAGLAPAETEFLKRDQRDIAAMIAASLTGVIYCCQEAARRMAKQNAGKIINIASVSGIIGRARGIYRRNGVKELPVDYAAAKAGVIGLTRDLAAYMAPYHVQVNSISPGGFDKGRAPPAFVAEFGTLTPLGRMGQMGQDIKGAALFLASSASDYITGQNLVVDGGFSTVK